MKKESRKAKESRLRSEEEARLRANYVEGKSNLLLDEYQKNKTAQEILLTDPDLEKVPRCSKEEFIKRELEKFDEGRVIIPSHKVHDPERQTAYFHHKFVSHLKDIHPEAIEELRPLSEYFGVLFYTPEGKDFAPVLAELKADLFDIRVKHGRMVRPETQFNFTYVWGEVFEEFQVAYLSFLIDNSDNPTSFVNETLMKYIENLDYRVDAINRLLRKHFERICQDAELILPNFFPLHNKITEWAAKHNLEKDWLLDYGYYFVGQFYEHPGIEVKDIIVGKREYSPRTRYREFKFQSKAWWAGEDGESATQFEKRTTQEFEFELESYMQQAVRYLRLDKMKKVTKSGSHESVEWLVYRTVKRWNTDRIIEKLFPNLSNAITDSDNSRKSYLSKKKQIETNMQKLQEFGLPWHEL